MEGHRITWGLILANLLFFIVIFSMPDGIREQAFLDLSFSFDTKFELWRWITSMFMHASASHFFMNMVGLYFFGKLLEEELEGPRYLAVYFVGGIMGNFIFMMTSTAPVVGASGAMFAVLGAAMLTNPLRRVHMYIFPLPLGVIAVMFAAFEAFIVHFQPEEFSNVANIAHIAGLMTGALFAVIYSPKKAAKGVLVLAISVILLIFLSPFFLIITGVGGFLWMMIDSAMGFFLYGLANMFSFIWYM